MLDGLSNLVDQSLLRQDAQHTHPQFVMLETIRSFAFERLEADGAGDLQIGDGTPSTSPTTPRPPCPISRPRIGRRGWTASRTITTTLRAAIAFAVETGDAHLGMRLVYALWRFWQSRAHLQEGAERVATVLAIPTDELRTELRARALEAGGGIAYWRGDLDSGRRYYDEALEIAARSAIEHLVADGLYNAAMVRNVLEINPRAIVDHSIAMLNEAIALYRETGDQLGAARALWGLGTVQYFSEDWPVAVDTFRAAEEALSAGDDEFMQGWVLHMLGTTEIRARPARLRPRSHPRGPRQHAGGR